MTNSERARMKMDDAIWKHGRRKGNLTVAIKKLKATSLADHPDVKKVIELLTIERKRMEKVELF